nr:RNA-binding protein 42-like [Tanacetum cinerariifolium]
VRGKDYINNFKVIAINIPRKTKGYGFVSFANPTDLADARIEMNGNYVGNRSIQLRKSNWKERQKAIMLAIDRSSYAKATGKREQTWRPLERQKVIFSANFYRKLCFLPYWLAWRSGGGAERN